MTTKAIKACPRCWRSFDRSSWLALGVADPQGIAAEPETLSRIDVRSCPCGERLAVEKAWLVDQAAGTIADDPTEIYEVEPGVFVLLWPIAPGLWEARKLSWSALHAAAESS